MASFEYLLTILPSLPSNLGDNVSASEVYRIIKAEEDKKLDYLINVLSIEDEIVKCAEQCYVLKNLEYEPDLSVEVLDSLPEDFKSIFFNFKNLSESDWMTAIYKAWFHMICNTGKKTGSTLLKKWGEWEYSLRMAFASDRLRRSNAELSSSTDISAYKASQELIEIGSNPESLSLIEAYKKISEPMKAEMALDQARLDFIENSAISYSFSADELVAYILKLRIYARYARMRPELGRKILQEVTAL